MLRFLPLLLLVGAASPAPFSVGGRGYPTLQAAVDAIGGGTGTVLVAPGVYRQCAVQERGRVTYRAAEPGTAVFEHEACEDKAALVLRGSGAVVDGLVFRGYRVADGNGAGVRSETGDLLVVNSTFLDSQEGIAGGEAARQRIVVDRSTFAGLGQCDEAPNCSHAIYLGNKGSVAITRSRFERGTGGHYVKLRVPVVEISDNSFDDTGGSKTNYMIDLPEGATGLIARNVFVQGAAKENGSTMIALRAESHTYPSAGLRVEGNQATLGAGAEATAFVGDWSGERLLIGTNRLGAGVRAFEGR